MEVFHRWELQTFEPLRYCPQCLGFWAARDALARGVADPYQEHPALRAVPAPARCRACGGRLKEDEACRSCGRKAPSLRCPSCGAAMERSRQHGVLVDLCAPCQGAWFDTGEISRVYDVQPFQGLAASTVDEHATDDEPPGWLVALQVLSHLILGF